MPHVDNLNNVILIAHAVENLDAVPPDNFCPNACYCRMLCRLGVRLMNSTATKIAAITLAAPLGLRSDRYSLISARSRCARGL
jgi:hypothetical protein